jgi:hypothetical protein
MKKVFLTLAAVAVFSFANAQFFVGGSLGFSTQSGTSSHTTETISPGIITTTIVDISRPTYSSFFFGPKAGYYFTEDFAIGLGLSYNRSNTTYYHNDDALENGKNEQKYGYKTVERELGIAPFIRYHFAEWDNLSLFGELSTGVMFGSSTYIYDINGNNPLYENGSEGIRFAVNIIPGIAYSVSDHVQIEATLNILEFNYMYSKSTYEQENIIENQSATITESEFSKNFNDRQGCLTIGFVYRF